MTQPVLEIEDLNISFFVRAGEIPAVMDFSCTVMPGETMGLVGESGCGKSTVALGIMRDMGNRGKIVGGKIKFKGRDMGEMSQEELRDLRGSKIAMIYQEPMASLNPAMRIGKQLMEVPIIHEQVSESEAYDRALEMLENVKLPDPARVMEAYPHQISGGQQQRIVIAMALLSKPDLLLLDEPTTALDVTVEAGIVELIKELGRKTGTSMLFISHNLGLILETCDKITVMYSGEAVETGTVHDVFDRMRHPYTQGLFNSIPLPGADKNSKPLIAIPGQLPLPMERPIGCNFGPRCSHYVESKCNAAAVKMHSIDGMPNHKSRCVRIDEIDWDAEPERKVVAAPAVPGKKVLEISNLKKYYNVAANKIFGGGDTRTVKANETISFHAREAETVAIVGESGCGKSTLAKVLLGLETSTDGEVLLDGRDIGKIEVSDRNPRTVASVQMVFQNPFDTLNPSHTVGSQIIRTLEKFGIGSTDADRHQRMLELLDLVKLPRAFADRMPRQLSGGQKQRIGVARAFAGEPRVVVADEPVSALDVSVQAAVTELLMDIQREAKTTMLFISHDLSVVRYIADRVVVMYLGHIVEQGTTDAIFSPPYHPYTEALLSAIPIADTSVHKKHIVLDGDIPSALNPPSGCPFQTRCPRKSQVEGNLCETQVPPVKDLGDGHSMKCHLSEDILRSMEPVIVLGEANEETTTAASTEPARLVDVVDDRDTATGGPSTGAIAGSAAAASLIGTVASRSGQSDDGEATKEAESADNVVAFTPSRSKTGEDETSSTSGDSESATSQQEASLGAISKSGENRTTSSAEKSGTKTTARSTLIGDLNKKSSRQTADAPTSTAAEEISSASSQNAKGASASAASSTQPTSSDAGSDNKAAKPKSGAAKSARTSKSTAQSAARKTSSTASKAATSQTKPKASAKSAPSTTSKAGQSDATKPVAKKPETGKSTTSKTAKGKSASAKSSTTKASKAPTKAASTRKSSTSAKGAKTASKAPIATLVGQTPKTKKSSSSTGKTAAKSPGQIVRQVDSQSTSQDDNQDANQGSD